MDCADQHVRVAERCSIACPARQRGAMATSATSGRLACLSSSSRAPATAAAALSPCSIPMLMEAAAAARSWNASARTCWLAKRHSPRRRTLPARHVFATERDLPGIAPAGLVWPIVCRLRRICCKLRVTTALLRAAAAAALRFHVRQHTASDTFTSPSLPFIWYCQRCVIPGQGRRNPPSLRLLFALALVLACAPCAQRTSQPLGLPGGGTARQGGA